MKPGQKLKIHLKNLLEDDGREHEDNVLSGNQETNIHLHGLHIDGDWPSDSVTRLLKPGMSAWYYAEIIDMHLPGTHWLHPHRHGSTLLQVAGGAASAVIVDEMREAQNGGWEALPVASGVDGAPEHLLFFQPIFNMDKINTDYQGDTLFESSISGSFTLVNGKRNPVLTIQQGLWNRMRIVNTAYDVFGFQFKVDQCEHMLLSKDGIYINDFPRKIEFAPVPPGGRADIMVRCMGTGVHSMQGYTSGSDDADSIAATVNVVPDLNNVPSNLGGLKVTLCDYDYLRDTLNAFVEEDCKCSTSFVVQDGFRVQGDGVFENDENQENARSFKGSDRIHKAVLNKVQQRELSASNHPYHQHVIPFQLNRIDNPTEPAEGFKAFYEKGDWHDVWPGTGMLRYNPVRFTGKMILHCHKLHHEDIGMMATETILPPGEKCECKWTDAPYDPDKRNKLIFLIIVLIILLIIVVIIIKKILEHWGIIEGPGFNWGTRASRETTRRETEPLVSS